ncbi:MAG TPA: hypothetical protein P5080_04735 [Candidatus Paceibacterota bacterium]|nr:hypothetical protein [Candidatus Pacearchaeota archaeon]HRZ51257.1 hypothetical protein [Candidatus Paceibacterota bacterium]HSA36979.1 hypothetical protein [Candidatus Paceibacterota bacterium]
MLSDFKERTAYLLLKLVILAALMGLAFLYIPDDFISTTSRAAINWSNSVQTAVSRQYPLVVSKVSTEAGQLRAEIAKDVENIKEQARSASSAKIKASFSDWIDTLFKTR